jgi:hypothetical protein
MKFCYEAAFFSILVNISIKGPLEDIFQSFTLTKISFPISTFLVLILECGWQISWAYAKGVEELSNQDILQLTNTM